VGVAASKVRVHFYHGGLLRRFLTSGAFADRFAPFVREPVDGPGWLPWSTLLFELNIWDSVVDRTGALPHPLNVENLRPMPTFDPGFSASLDELCLGRAQALAASGQPLRLFWSGGIDSTLVLTSFLRAGVPHDQLEVVYTSHSLLEYPAFLSQHLPTSVRRTQVHTFPHHNFVPDAEAEQFQALPCLGDFIDPASLNVTGGLGDKLFNSHTLLTQLGYGRALVPYQQVLGPALLEAVQPLVARSPLPLRTVYDVTWWLYFALYFQDELLQLLAGVSGSNVSAQRSALRVFFDTDGFQQWSLHHRDRVATNHPHRLKLDAKQLIALYTHDHDYTLTKLKQGSLKFRKTPNAEWDNPILFVLEDGSLVRSH
jgi:hypothetical protein